MKNFHDAVAWSSRDKIKHLHYKKAIFPPLNILSLVISSFIAHYWLVILNLVLFC